MSYCPRIGADEIEAVKAHSDRAGTCTVGAHLGRQVQPRGVDGPDIGVLAPFGQHLHQVPGLQVLSPVGDWVDVVPEGTWVTTTVAPAIGLPS